MDSEPPALPTLTELRSIRVRRRNSVAHAGGHVDEEVAQRPYESDYAGRRVGVQAAPSAQLTVVTPSDSINADCGLRRTEPRHRKRHRGGTDHLLELRPLRCVFGLRCT
ncbi:MAG: hypothetical protein U1F25_13950 [Rubrivivax sp.]